jgi:two-component system, chemotaxis family, protein-glutamate methylesterase/glutaminase
VQGNLNRKLRVLIVDDSSFVRRVIRLLLEDRNEFEVVGEAANGRLGLDLARMLQPDVITLDQDMPTMSGVEMLRQLRRESDVPVVIVSALPVDWNIMSADVLLNVRAVEKTFSNNPLDLSIFAEELTETVLRTVHECSCNK